MASHANPRRRRKLGAVRLQPNFANLEGACEPSGSSSENAVEEVTYLRAQGTLTPTKEGTISQFSSNDESFWSVVLSLKNMTESGLQTRGIGATVRDKSLDAMNAVKDLGKAAVELAHSLDTTFEQMLGSLSSWKAPSSGQNECSEPQRPSVSGHERTEVGSLEGQDGFDPHGPSPQKLVKRPHLEPLPKTSVDPEVDVTRASNQPRRSAADQDSIREPGQGGGHKDTWSQVQRLQTDLRRYSKKCVSLATENKKLREQGAKTLDDLNEQVRAQVETLVADKARLAQENARLIRENLGLQELLQYTFSLQWQKDYAEKLVCNINEELDYVSDGEGDFENDSCLTAEEMSLALVNSSCISASSATTGSRQTPPRTPACCPHVIRRMATPVSL